MNKSHNRKTLRYAGKAMVCSALVCLSTGCLSVSGTKQYVSIDSEPRGQTVEIRTARNEYKVIGTTPSFYRLEREPGHHFRLGGISARNEAVDCSFRWAAWPLLNVQFYLLSPGSLGLFLTVNNLGWDAASGAAWTCPARLVFRVPKAPQERVCRKFVVLPPQDDDEKYAEYLAEEWARSIKRHLSDCDEVVPPDVAEKYFLFVGISSFEKYNLGKAPREGINRLGFQTGATHAVTLEASVKMNKISFRAHATDLHRGVEEELPATTAIAAKDAIPPRTWLSRKFFSSFRMVPNSIGYALNAFDGLKFEDMQRNQIPGEKLVENERDLLPRYISNWSFRSLQHPLGYSTWDVGFEFSPAFSMRYFNHEVSYTNRDDAAVAAGASKNRVLQAEAWLGYFPMTASLTGHTPLGALTGTIGGGLAWRKYTATGSEERSEAGFTAGYNASLQYTAFLTRRLFVWVEVDNTSLNKPIFRDSQISAGSFTRVELGLGLYLPEGRTWARAAF